MGEAQNIRYIQRSLYRIPVFIQIIPVKLFVSNVERFVSVRYIQIRYRQVLL